MTIISDRKYFLQRGKPYYMRLACSLQDLGLAKQVDDAAFGSHHGITQEELVEIHKHGYVILLYNENDELVGESQILTESISTDILPHEFESPTCYCYGIAIHPDHQGHGLGRRLAKEHELLAITKGMKVMEMTIRIENYASLRVMTGLGHKVLDYLSGFYGQDPTKDNRLLLSKKLSPDFPPIGAIHEGTILVPIDFNSPHDAEAHQKIASLILTGHAGIHVDHNGLYFKKE
ncbi:TPA: GNAT family N-acetyltransferase [Candidatus Berkelbacteria bacterium]|uniref:N-acetyltransferase domain-containing protein n=1 Tax=Berkelbacteria bacterium GW2011_GWE1_39_12 TaxID=1618337 RepID=A0A0G4B3T3_9BACT|nr:MAG: hypothetical protein UT28_C0001G0272 [Berkelbacteria bacterium GW2011_GWE1_39_12]HBO60668.1 GNAT family N-acetyltransferase [Candidatus Berkelbacteria bacterium]